MIKEYDERIEELINLLKTIKNNIYIVGHKNSDMDSLCSCLSLTYILNKLGKNAKSLIETENTKIVKYFNMDDYIVHEINCSDYTLITVDLNTLSRIESTFEKYYNKAKYNINIDHHSGNKTNANFVLSIKNISSTCEIIYNISKRLGMLIDKTLAELLFVGLVSDTDLFFNRTTSDSLSMASDLLKQGIDNHFLIEKFYLKKSYLEMKIIADMIHKLKYDCFHYIVIDMSDKLYRDVSYAIISKKCIPTILNIEDIEFLVVIIKINSKTKGEIRSKNSKDASLLARRLTGGGHSDAAGFSNSKSCEEVIAITKDFLGV